MKKLIFIFSLLISLSSFAKTNYVNCQYYEGGYDDETISVSIKNETVTAIEYMSYQGEVGPFHRVSNTLFEYSTDELIVNHIISFNNDFKNASLMVVYKNSGKILASQHFICD